MKVLGVIGTLALCMHASAATLSAPDDLAAEPGAVFDVPVTLENVNGMLAYSVRVMFDQDVVGIVTPVSASVGGLTVSWDPPIVNASLAGEISVAGFNETVASGSGTLVILHLRILPTAVNGQSSPLAFATVDLNDGAISVTTVPGLVEVAQTLNISPLHSLGAALGATLPVSIKLEQTNTLLAFSFDLVYDPAVFDAAEVVVLDGDLPMSWDGPESNVAIPGRVSIANFDPVALLPGANVTLCQVVLSVREDAPQIPTPYPTPLRLENVELDNGDVENPIVYTAVSTEVLVAPADAFSLRGALVTAAVIGVLGCLVIMYRQRLAARTR